MRERIDKVLQKRLDAKEVKYAALGGDSKVDSAGVPNSHMNSWSAIEEKEDEQEIFADAFLQQDWDGISTDMRRQMELMAISKHAQPKVSNKWSGDPFVEYQKLADKPFTKTNYIQRNIHKARKLEPATASRRHNGPIKSQYSQLKVRLNPPKYIDTDLMNVDIVPYSAAEPTRLNGSVFS